MKQLMLPLLVLLAVGLYPLNYAGMYAGDAVIHLVYARNGANGHLFEYNPGEVAPGVTSPGFMLLITFLYACFSEGVVPLAVKILDLLAWYLSLALVYLLSLRMVERREWALAAVAIAGLLPGSAFNANIGMENGVFAATVLMWLYLAERWQWWQPLSEDRWIAKEITLGAVAGIACWMRPEGLVLVPILVSIRTWACVRLRANSCWDALGGRTIVLVAAWALLAIGLVAFHRIYTGHWIPSSVAARIIQGHRDGFSLGPVPFTWKFLERLVVYGPLTIGWLVGSWVVLTQRYSGRCRQTAQAAVVVSWLFFVLYSTVLGAAHLGRYVIFVMFLMILVAIIGGEHLWARVPRLVAGVIPRWVIFAVLGALLMAVFGAETLQRRNLGSHDAVAQNMAAPGLRRAFSDELLKALGNPEERPVVVGYQEVQSRYWLDERFVVRALDGRVDSELLKFVRDGYVDHIGYIKARKIHFLTEYPNYNRDPSAWALSRLEALKPGESLDREGLHFTMLASGFVRVDSLGAKQAPNR